MYIALTFDVGSVRLSEYVFTFMSNEMCFLISRGILSATCKYSLCKLLRVTQMYRLVAAARLRSEAAGTKRKRRFVQKTCF